VVPANSKTEAFLAHNYVPVEFTEADFDQVTDGNYLTKVVYLPDPQHQAPTGPGLAQLVSTQLPGGADPIVEAQKRGCILLVVRLGGIDLEAANSPPLDNPGMFGQPRGVGGAANTLPGTAQPLPQGVPAPAPLPPQMLPPVNPQNPLPGGPQVEAPAPVMPGDFRIPASPMKPAVPGTLPPMPPQGPLMGRKPPVDPAVRTAVHRPAAKRPSNPAAAPPAASGVPQVAVEVSARERTPPVKDQPVLSADADRDSSRSAKLRSRTRRGLLDGLFGSTESNEGR
jgi:hypothetical protein